MKSRLLVAVGGAGTLLSLFYGMALSYGYDFVFPGARLSVISGYTYTNPPSHQAYDYRFSMHTKVAAAKAGTISASKWTVQDGNETGCNNEIVDRGNYVIINHGGGLETWYFHLSNTGYTPGYGIGLALGEYMAYSGDTGCGGAHLHFATKLNGILFDPYAGSTHWVDEQPIPMGYRNQDGIVRGPYALDDTKIRDEWLAWEGVPRAPIESDWTNDTCSPLTYHVQRFERGEIYYCGNEDAEYVPYSYYNYVYGIQARYSCTPGENSFIVVTNNTAQTAIVSITILDYSDQVRDSRVYKSLAPYGQWEFSVHEVYFDWLVRSEPWIFDGWAIVASDHNVEVEHNISLSQNCDIYLPAALK